MIWRRTFVSLYEEICMRSVPRPLLLPPLKSLVFSKRSWSFAFEDEASVPTLIYIGDKGSEDMSAYSQEPMDQVDLNLVPCVEDMVFTAPPIETTKRRSMKS